MVHVCLMRIIQLKYKQFPQSINLTFLVRTLIDAGAVPMAVGGCVRDFLLNKKYKDIDLEIYGLTFKKLVKVLSSIGKVDLVGILPIIS